MLNSQKIGFERYENWGWLIYAVAMFDRGVHSKEVDKLRSFTLKYYLEVDAVHGQIPHVALRPFSIGF